jgi:uracil-DNA glycosylase
MRVDECIKCEAFPCLDVKHDYYIIPSIDVEAKQVHLIMISEATPNNPSDYYYAKGTPLFQETTVQAFKDADVDVSSIQDILEMGVYLTTAVKCGKIDYNIKSNTIKECSFLLEKELSLFSNLKVIMLMGDVAKKAINYIAKRNGEPRVIPAGSTYKIRNREYFFQGKRVFPSYLQAGPSFFIEKSKRRMIGEDIIEAMKLLE